MFESWSFLLVLGTERGGGVSKKRTPAMKDIFRYLNLCVHAYPTNQGKNWSEERDDPIWGDLLTEKLVLEKAALKEGGLISPGWSFIRCSAVLDISDLRAYHPWLVCFLQSTATSRASWMRWRSTMNEKVCARVRSAASCAFRWVLRP